MADLPESVGALRRAAASFRRASETLDRRRGDLHAAVIAAVGDGMSKSEAGRISGYTREYVAKLVDDRD